MNQKSTHLTWPYIAFLASIFTVTCLSIDLSAQTFRSSSYWKQYRNEACGGFGLTSTSNSILSRDQTSAAPISFYLGYRYFFMKNFALTTQMSFSSVRSVQEDDIASNFQASNLSPYLEWHLWQERTSHKFKLRGAHDIWNRDTLWWTPNLSVIGLSMHAGVDGFVGTTRVYQSQFDEWSSNGSSFSYAIGYGAMIRYAINFKWRMSFSGTLHHVPGGAVDDYFTGTLSLNYKIIKRRGFKRTKSRRSSPSFGGHISKGSFTPNIRTSSFATNNDQSNLSAKAGILTGAELNDFAKWTLWENMEKDRLFIHSDKWKIDPTHRYTVQLLNHDMFPVVNTQVQMVDMTGNVLWSSKTDNTGKAELWRNMINTTDDLEKPIQLKVFSNGKTYIIDQPKEFGQGINQLILEQPHTYTNKVDIAFSVDATGSMSDEIKFLQEELKDIVQKVNDRYVDLDFHMGSVFYRAPGNEYEVRYDPMTPDLEQAIGFINDQNANEGGDESMELALHTALDSLKWRDDARARILFLVLDEPPSQDSLSRVYMHNNLFGCSKAGIRVVPIVASGANRSEKELEFMMRSAALATNGTYVFLTDHSGVGDTHSIPETDEFDVELLNDLMMRVINNFIYIPTEEETDFSQFVENDTTYIINAAVIAHEIVDSALIDSLKAMPFHEVRLAVASIEEIVYDTSKLKYEKVKKDIPYVQETISTELRFYPNPANQHLVVQSNRSLEQVYIADVNGKVLARYHLDANVERRIDLSQFARGVYLLQFRNPEGKMRSGKFVITR